MSVPLASRTLVIVPTYNEAGNIEILVAAILQATPAVDILFVDDHSQDGTQDRIMLMQPQYGSKLHLISRAGKLGLGTAYIAGFQWALTRCYHVIVQMDADLTHDPAHLPHFLTLLESSDVVVGSRYVDGGGHVIGVSYGNASARRGLFMHAGSSGCQSRIPLVGITSGIDGCSKP